VSSDPDLVAASDVILSVVPPRDALATAQRILAAALSSPSNPDGTAGVTTTTRPLYFADMNAVSPASVKTVAALFTSPTSHPTTRQIHFIDGSILGGPPKPPTQSQTQPTPNNNDEEEEPAYKQWTRPLLPTSGPTPLPLYLSQVLNIRHIAPEIGQASALKMCFASLSKGFSAVAIESITTATRYGVLSHLQSALLEVSGQALLTRLEKAVTGVAPKAYRWVREMEEISATHSGSGGIAEEEEEMFSPEYIFRGAADVFRTLAEDTALGREKIGKRQRGTTVEDVAEAVLEGLRERNLENKRRKRTEPETREEGEENEG
jgi:hypothetical protein